MPNQVKAHALLVFYSLCIIAHDGRSAKGSFLRSGADRHLNGANGLREIVLFDRLGVVVVEQHTPIERMPCFIGARTDELEALFIDGLPR